MKAESAYRIAVVYMLAGILVSVHNEQTTWFMYLLALVAAVVFMANLVVFVFNWYSGDHEIGLFSPIRIRRRR